VDRKTARRYVVAAEAEGLTRESGVEAVTDELIGAVLTVVRPARPHGHGAAWELLLARQEQITTWVAGGGGQPPLSVVKIAELLTRQGCVVPYRTLHRFTVERCGFGVKTTTMRINDGEPGVECQIDFGAPRGAVVSDGGERPRRLAVVAAGWSWRQPDPGIAGEGESSRDKVRSVQYCRMGRAW